MSLVFRELNSLVQGKDELVTVGWGSKETQFQGSAGKASREEKLDVSKVAYESDSRKTHIKWRSDAQFVVISFFDKNTGERKMSVFDRNGDFISRIKNESSIEEWFAIRPTGNYIATTRKNNDLSRSIVFFERNGEKRYETITLSSAGQVIGLDWDMEAYCLAILLRYTEYDEIEIWTVSNYDWTRKWTTRFFSRVIDWNWDSEKGRHLDVISNNGVICQLSFDLVYCVQNSKAVVQASGEIRFTNLNRLLIPPPMCEYSIPVKGASHAMAFDGNRLALIFSDWSMQTFKVNPTTEILELDIATPISVLPGTRFISSMSWADNNLIMVSYGDAITIDSLNMDGQVVSIYQSNNPIVWLGLNPITKRINYATSEGNFFEIKEGCGIKMFTLEPCDSYDIKYFGKISNSHIAERAVELGSRLVSSSLVESNVVMQMPRGNLEVIYPRPFIIRNLKYLMDSQQYIEALKIMKKHRIDMNFLVDHDPRVRCISTFDNLFVYFLFKCEKIMTFEKLKLHFQTFFNNARHFIMSANDPDLINLFIVSLSNEKSELCDKSDPIYDKVLRVSELIANEVLSLTIESRLQMFTVLLSALLKIDPPRIEQSLKYIKQHTDQSIVFMKKFLSLLFVLYNYKADFLSEEFTLFKWVNIKQVAEVSNRDPKEYIPLLNELKDDICNLYASHLERKGVWMEAAILFEKANNHDKVLQCLELARNVDTYIHRAQKFGRLLDTTQSTVLKMAVVLKGSGNWLEAAKALEFAGAPISEIIDAYSKANKWSKAVDIVDAVGLWTECGQLSKDGFILRYSLVERAGYLLEDIDTQNRDIETYSIRLETVRSIKNEKISNLKEGLLTNRDLEDIDAFSDATSALSILSSKSGSSKISTTSAMRKRKQVVLYYLFYYLFVFVFIPGEMHELLPSLVRLNEIDLATKVQRNLIKLVHNAQLRIHQIWPQKLQPRDLPGPLSALYSINGTFCFPDGGGMPSSVILGMTNHLRSAFISFTVAFSLILAAQIFKVFIHRIAATICIFTSGTLLYFLAGISQSKYSTQQHCAQSNTFPKKHCTLDASCLSCRFPDDCIMGEILRINCTSIKECGSNQISTRRMVLCRYCWQTEPSEYSCSPRTNCSTTATGLVTTKCTVHPSTICKGHRTFNKRVRYVNIIFFSSIFMIYSDRCNWSSGISWAKTMLLSVTLGGFGADRFYLGLWKSAIGKLFSFGGLGIWTIVDVVLVASGYIRPADGSMFM
uniref:Dolichyl-diphosphooligosaccharide--protein glycosyltransferase subunit KCP2 n=1 Tax=Heterorhabditis bacteriophora TaxID=37862 RepID=A0A1I7XI19_HETBA